MSDYFKFFILAILSIIIHYLNVFYKLQKMQTVRANCVIFFILKYLLLANIVKGGVQLEAPLNQNLFNLARSELQFVLESNKEYEHVFVRHNWTRNLILCIKYNSYMFYIRLYKIYKTMYRIMIIVHDNMIILCIIKLFTVETIQN